MVGLMIGVGLFVVEAYLIMTAIGSAARVLQMPLRRTARTIALRACGRRAAGFGAVRARHSFRALHPRLPPS